MRVWKFIHLLCFVCAYFASEEPRDRFVRDWGKSPAIEQIDTDGDIFAVGDVHGDYERLHKLLAAAEIIGPAGNSEKVNWVAGRSVLVFLGDMIDKGPRSLEVLLFVRALRDAAVSKGGRVIVLMGNHEAGFLAGLSGEKGAEFAFELKHAGLVPGDVAACHGDLGAFLCSLPFAARVRDWFFSHAGDTGGRSLERLAADLRHGVDQDGFGTQELLGRNGILEARLSKTAKGTGPWFEEESPNHDGRRVLLRYTAALGVAHLVQGHQPAAIVFADGTKRASGEMFQRYGLIFLADTGMSEGVGYSGGAVLHITAKRGEKAIAICSGKQTTIWDDRNRPEIGIAAPCEK